MPSRQRLPPRRAATRSSRSKISAGKIIAVCIAAIVGVYSYVLTKAVLTPQVRLEDRASGLSSSARIRRPRGSVRPSPNATSALLANRVSQGPRAKATIAYLTSITGCPLKDRDKFIDAAAVLRHSIHQSSIRSPASGSRYDYVTYAIVHTNASACQPALERVGYTVLVRDNPVELYEVRNEGYRERLANPNAGCCQEKEFLKLYAYTMHGYQVVVHLDMDFLVLKPMDILFDSFWEPDEAEKWVPHAMWPEHQRWKGRIETMFTRDYPMSKPNRAAEKVGMQGGFWIVRPNQTAYDELVEHIREGNFQSGWFDGKTKYPGFYGAAMIQGLIAFYYGHYHPGQAIELDRCTHNQMVDPPRSEKGGGGCFVPVPEDQCRDCRLGNVTDVYSAHFTFCIKPWKCPTPQSFSSEAYQRRGRLCLDLHEAWHRVRYDLEISLEQAQPFTLGDRSYGHCPKKNQYKAMDWGAGVEL